MSTIVRPRRRCPLGSALNGRSLACSCRESQQSLPVPQRGIHIVRVLARKISVWPRAASSRVGAKGGSGGEAALRKHGREGFLLRSRACAGLLFAFFYSLLSSRSRPTREGYFPQDWSSLPAGTPSGGRVGLRLELAWLDRAETPC